MKRVPRGKSPFPFACIGVHSRFVFICIHATSASFAVKMVHFSRKFALFVVKTAVFGEEITVFLRGLVPLWERTPMRNPFGQHLENEQFVVFSAALKGLTMWPFAVLYRILVIPPFPCQCSTRLSNSPAIVLYNVPSISIIRIHCASVVRRINSCLKLKPYESVHVAWKNVRRNTEESYRSTARRNTKESYRYASRRNTKESCRNATWKSYRDAAKKLPLNSEIHNKFLKTRVNKFKNKIRTMKWSVFVPRKNAFPILFKNLSVPGHKSAHF